MNNGHLEPSDIATLEAAQERGDYLAIVRLTSGSHAGSLWSAALTAHFGPTGLAILWRDEDDRPSAECLATVPGVAEVMGEARATVRNLIAYWRRELCGTA